MSRGLGDVYKRQEEYNMTNDDYVNDYIDAESEEEAIRTAMDYLSEQIQNNGFDVDVNKEEMEVEVTNISKGGMGFKTEEFLPLNSYYEAKVVLWTRESFDAIIEIVRMENDGTDEKNTYGCRFVGLSPAEQFKIDVYQIVSETSFN